MMRTRDDRPKDRRKVKDIKTRERVRDGRKKLIAFNTTLCPLLISSSVLNYRSS
jgi:hypothetical protein